MLSSSDTIRTIIEFLAIVIAITGLIMEPKIIKFEDKIVEWVKENLI